MSQFNLTALVAETIEELKAKAIKKGEEAKEKVTKLDNLFQQSKPHLESLDKTAQEVVASIMGVQYLAKVAFDRAVADTTTYFSRIVEDLEKIKAAAKSQEKQD